jgi:hypothetical protein
MGAELGRISGPLLANNLVRNGIDLQFETDLLYLDVHNQRVGIKTTTPNFPLEINGDTLTTNFIVDNWFTVPDFYIATNVIQNTSGPIYIHPAQQILSGILDGGVSGTVSYVADSDGGSSGTLVFSGIIDAGTSDPYGGAPRISAPAVRTDNIKVADKTITNFVSNSDIELNPTGITVFNTNRVNVDGSLHATGNVTYDGNIIFGSDNTDSVQFRADINSNITPDVSNTYNLGSTDKRWDDVFSPVITTTNIVTGSVIANNINLLTRPGKTLYVSTNGVDTNYGNHAHSTFASIKKALSVATSGDKIVIFPGTYTEIFPLTVPQGVSVQGASIRSVIIQPTNATKTNDAFLLNGDSTVEFLSIINFFYNSLTNTGYAFRFASGFKSLTKSPYAANITVITQGSITSLTDPRGFNSADAGAGAYVDGAVADPTGTMIPTMLFFAVTFITPNQDAITALNGVRVEWLNSFSYFARRGIYLKNGTLGRASQGSIYGAEMRSINSANVYGTYGAIADGDQCLAYLIGHNWGYIGSGGDSTNDARLVVQANEVEEHNGGKIYFDSTDQIGDVRIGNIFYVNAETGNVAFDAQSINILGNGNITLESATSTTKIDSLGIQTGNIRIYDNNITSLVGPVNIKANNGANTSYLNTDVSITGSLVVTGSNTVYGNVYFGDTASDPISINAYLTQDINPNVTNNLNLGSSTKRWNTLFNNLLDIDGVIRISSNTITTLTTNTDLQLIAAGSGIIHVPNNNVKIDNSLTVNNDLTINGTSNVKNLTVVGTTILVGDLNQTGNTYITGLFANNNIQITGNSYFQVPDIKIYNNIISNQDVGADLIFTANGSGGVKIEKLTITDSTIANTWIGATTATQKGITLTPSGTGIVSINSNKALKLPVGTNLTSTLTSVGNIRYNSSYNRYEGYVPNGLVSLNRLYSSDSSNSSYITNATKFTGTVQSIAAVVDEYTITVLDPSGLLVGYKVVSGPGVAAGAEITDITGSTITLNLPNVASLTGSILFGDSALSFVAVGGLQIGQTVSGTGIQTGTTIVSWTSNSVVLSKPISALLPSGTTITFGSVNTTFITPELTPGAADNTLRFGINGVVTAALTSTAFSTNTWNISNINISGTTINNLTSENVYLAPNSGVTSINNISFENSNIINTTAGAITIAATGQGYVKFGGKGAVVFPFGDNAGRRLTPELGEMRYNTELGYLEVHSETDWIPALGTSGAASEDVVNETMNLWSLILG